MKKEYIIGIGSRARQGKDTVANIIKEMRENVYIIHWADALYDELKNKERKSPLITSVNIGKSGELYYSLLDDAINKIYRLYHHEEVPYLHQIMIERGIKEYWGMDEKDAPMLQFWGTDFRRRKVNENYWVDKIHEQILLIGMSHDGDDKTIYILIPDTRFLNEYKKLKSYDWEVQTDIGTSAKFVKVFRMNKDGTQFFDTSRNANHPSEAELDDTYPDYAIYAEDGDLGALQSSTERLLFLIEHNQKVPRILSTGKIYLDVLYGN